MAEQQPRGVLPDAMDDTTAYLIKQCAYLRLTYEIRLMAFMAQQNAMTFVLLIPQHCQFASALNQFVDDGYVQIRRD